MSPQSSRLRAGVAALGLGLAGILSGCVTDQSSDPSTRMFNEAQFNYAAGVGNLQASQDAARRGHNNTANLLGLVGGVQVGLSQMQAQYAIRPQVNVNVNNSQNAPAAPVQEIETPPKQERQEQIIYLEEAFFDFPWVKAFNYYKDFNGDDMGEEEEYVGEKDSFRKGEPITLAFNCSVNAHVMDSEEGSIQIFNPSGEKVYDSPIKIEKDVVYRLSTVKGEEHAELMREIFEKGGIGTYVALMKSSSGKVEKAEFTIRE